MSYFSQPAPIPELRTANVPVYEMPDFSIIDEYQRVACGKPGIRFQRDQRHAARIRREARKVGLVAKVQLMSGSAAVLLRVAS